MKLLQNQYNQDHSQFPHDQHLTARLPEDLLEGLVLLVLEGDGGKGLGEVKLGVLVVEVLAEVSAYVFEDLLDLVREVEGEDLDPAC